MKVKVNYTMAIEEVPELIQDILSSLKQSITLCNSHLVFNPNDFGKMASEFKAAREKLEVADAQIEDVLNITAGWLEATRPQAEEDEIDREIINEE
jgi:hypothetical protein